MSLSPSETSTSQINSNGSTPMSAYSKVLGRALVCSDDAYSQRNNVTLSPVSASLPISTHTPISTQELLSTLSALTAKANREIAAEQEENKLREGDEKFMKRAVGWKTTLYMYTFILQSDIY